jgi:nucleoside-diphosphate-sugar epimerase
MIKANPLADDLDHVLDHTRDQWDELRGNRVFITGATGFFGCWLLETFAWANQHLHLNAKATILTRSPEKLKRQLPHLDTADGTFEIIVGDVRNFSFPAGSCSHLINAATESSVELNAKNPTIMFDTIVEGTRHCLDFALQSGVKKFLLTSSGAVYGKQPAHISHLTEDFAGGPDPLDPQSAYGEGKRAAELLCVLQARQSNLEAKIARCFAFVGPYMKLGAHFAIGNFIRDQLAGIPISVRGDGTTIRSYMYASDLMIWLWTILFRGKSSRAYNVGSEEPITIAELASRIAATASPRTPVNIAEKPIPDASVARYVPSTARAQKELGLRCQISLQEAIERTLNWNQSPAPDLKEPALQDRLSSRAKRGICSSPAPDPAGAAR